VSTATQVFLQNSTKIYPQIFTIIFIRDQTERTDDGPNSDIIISSADCDTVANGNYYSSKQVEATNYKAYTLPLKGSTTCGEAGCHVNASLYVNSTKTL